MELEEIFNKIKSICDNECRDVYYDWQDIVKLPEKRHCVYIKKKEDCIYIGLYKKEICKSFSKNTLQIYDRHYVKSENQYIKIYTNKVIYNKKALTFKTLTKITTKNRYSNHSFFSNFSSIIRQIYNIHPTINLSRRNYIVTLMDEVKGVTQKEYVDKLFPDKPQEFRNKLYERDVNTLKLLSMIWDLCATEDTINMIASGTPIDLQKDKLGLYYYLPKPLKVEKEKDSWKTTGKVYNKVSNWSNYETNHLDNYVLNYIKPKNTIHRLIASGDKENIVLGRHLFMQRYKKFYPDNIKQQNQDEVLTVDENIPF